jgi:hypothetical protein
VFLQFPLLCGEGVDAGGQVVQGVDGCGVHVGRCGLGQVGAVSDQGGAGQAG